PWLTPILFVSIDVGFIVWLLLKERALRRKIVGSRLGLAVVSALRGQAHGRIAAPLESADEEWVAREFGLDGSGTLELGEVSKLPARQGSVLSADALAKLREKFDHDRNGGIDRHELAAFLATWFPPEPSLEDELHLVFRNLDRDGNGRVTADELR